MEDQELPINFSALSTQTEGYSATDLKDLVARAIHQVAMRASNPGVKVSLFNYKTEWLTKVKIIVSSDTI